MCTEMKVARTFVIVFAPHPTNAVATRKSSMIVSSILHPQNNTFKDSMACNRFTNSEVLIK